MTPHDDPEHSAGSLAAYGTLVATYCLTFGGLLYLGKKKHLLPRRVGASDIVLLGFATHRLTRILARDRVTMPARAPFATYEGPAGAGEVKERPRGRGLRRAIGRLVTCQYCLGPWVASSMLAALAARPRETRVVASMLAATTVSDFLHQTYARLR